MVRPSGASQPVILCRVLFIIHNLEIIYDGDERREPCCATPHSGYSGYSVDVSGGDANVQASAVTKPASTPVSAACCSCDPELQL